MKMPSISPASRANGRVEYPVVVRKLISIVVLFVIDCLYSGGVSLKAGVGLHSAERKRRLL